MPFTSSGRGSGFALAIDLVNSWDEFDEPPELLRNRSWLERWLRFHGFPGAAAAVTDGDVERARELRAQLTAAFDAPGEAEAVSVLAHLLTATAVPPVFERAASGWRFRWWPDESAGLAFVAPYAATGLLELIRDVGWQRFGRCSGSPCRCVYVDRSRNRSRRYCCSLCANRVAQAVHRQRRRSRG
jgi:predicted RNA-binding Zn ribbon-like protein